MAIMNKCIELIIDFTVSHILVLFLNYFSFQNFICDRMILLLLDYILDLY